MKTIFVMCILGSVLSVVVTIVVLDNLGQHFFYFFLDTLLDFFKSCSVSAISLALRLGFLALVGLADAEVP